MLKEEFLRLLAEQVDPGERERVRGYYAEMIDDRVEAGQAEEEVIAGFGDVREIAQALEVQRKVRAFHEKPTMSGGAAALIAAACLFASPIALPLAVALLVVIITAHAALFSVLVAVVAAAAALGIGGAAGFVGGIVTLFPHPMGGLFLMGAGLACLGLGLVATWGSVKLLVAAARGTWGLWSYCINKIMGKKGGGFASPWQEQRFLLPAGDVTELVIRAANFRINAAPRESTTDAPGAGEVEVLYHETEGIRFEESFAQGRMSLIQQPWAWRGAANWFQPAAIEVRVPGAHALACDLQSSNGGVTVRRLPFARLCVKTSNAGIEIEDAQAKEGEVAAITSNGGIHLAGVSAAGELKAITNNGRVTFERVSAPSLSGMTSNGRIVCKAAEFAQAKLTTSNGGITCALPGRQEDYTVAVKTSNGKIRVGDVQLAGGSLGSGGKTLQLTTSNGSIGVTFEPIAAHAMAMNPEGGGEQ